FENDQYKEHILHYWQEKKGITNHFVSWQFLDKDLLDTALHCIPAIDLKNIFERLLFDIKSNRSGLPDLIQFFPETGSYRMIEVKGPGDRIQDNQRRWLDYFSQKIIPAEVWYVSWQ
ncbi:MAG: VRR-NUC domain-containing protein, partial [Chitinophagaceae bacterium]